MKINEKNQLKHRRIVNKDSCAVNVKSVIKVNDISQKNIMLYKLTH